MTVANVLRLDEFRDRRFIRQARARAFVARDRTRARLFEHLVEIAEVSGSDRAAVVWIDEYGPGLVHPHLIVDTIADTPRRTFSPEVLQRAWERGVPGAFDHGSEDASGAATFAVALGSDGARGWFVVADSVGRRRRLDDWTRHRLMFLTGEASALVLHRDLDQRVPEEGEGFDGWRILRDLEGFESDPARCAEVEARFVVGRLIRRFVDEDLVVPESQRVEQVRAAREELGRMSPAGREHEELDRALEAYSSGEARALLDSTLSLAGLAERHEHVSGALELYECAFDISGRLRGGRARDRGRPGFGAYPATTGSLGGSGRLVRGGARSGAQCRTPRARRSLARRAGASSGGSGGTSPTRVTGSRRRSSLPSPRGIGRRWLRSTTT